MNIFITRDNLADKLQQAQMELEYAYHTGDAMLALVCRAEVKCLSDQLQQLDSEIARVLRDLEACAGLLAQQHEEQARHMQDWLDLDESTRAEELLAAELLMEVL
jgi:hypothetical protein